MMHQKYSHERVLAKQGASFLARQRQALYKNPVPLNTAIANTLASSSSPRSVHVCAWLQACVCVFVNSEYGYIQYDFYLFN